MFNKQHIQLQNFQKVQSTHGLVTTVAYKFGRQPAVYALEGIFLFASFINCFNFVYR